MDLAGKVAVITGASSGIGQATAEILYESGMSILATARRMDRLVSLAEELPGIEYLEGVHTAALLWASRKSIPCFANLSRLGVGIFERVL